LTTLGDRDGSSFYRGTSDTRKRSIDFAKQPSPRACSKNSAALTRRRTPRRSISGYRPIVTSTERAASLRRFQRPTRIQLRGVAMARGTPTRSGIIRPTTPASIDAESLIRKEPVTRFERLEVAASFRKGVDPHEFGTESWLACDFTSFCSRLEQVKVVVST